MNEYRNIIAVEEPTLSRRGEERFVVIDADTGELLDDAQGWGYKSKSNAHASYKFTHRDRSKDAEREDRETHIRQWMKEHKSFVNQVDAIVFDMVKGSGNPDEKFDAKFLREMLELNNLTTDFTLGELLRVWKRKH